MKQAQVTACFFFLEYLCDMRTYNQQQQQRLTVRVRHRHAVRTETDRRVSSCGDVNETDSGSAGTEGCCQRMQQQASTLSASANDFMQLALKYIANNTES